MPPVPSFPIQDCVLDTCLESHLELNQPLVVVLGKLLIGLLYVAHLQLEMHVQHRSAIQLIQCS